MIMQPASLEQWDEKVVPQLSRLRQNCFWIKEGTLNIRHAFKLMKEHLPEWPTEAGHQLKGTIRELKEAIEWLEQLDREMDAKVKQ